MVSFTIGFIYLSFGYETKAETPIQTSTLDETVPCVDRVCLSGDSIECFKLDGSHRVGIKSQKNSFINGTVYSVDIYVDNSQECN